MYRSTGKRKLNNKRVATDKTGNILVAIGVLIIFAGALWSYFCVYKPDLQRYIKRSRQVYTILQDETMRYYKNEGLVYASLDEKIDPICEVLKNKYYPDGNCLVGSNGFGEPNIRFEDGSAIYGFEKKPHKWYRKLVKDIIIDVDGEKGANAIGVDRVPVRINSTGRMGGLITPVNCNVSDYRELGISLSPACQQGVDINFMTATVPFSFSILQIGSDNGNTLELSKNISFLRADCSAFGAEMTGAETYCERNGLTAMPRCYMDYLCAISLTK